MAVNHYRIEKNGPKTSYGRYARKNDRYSLYMYTEEMVNKVILNLEEGTYALERAGVISSEESDFMFGVALDLKRKICSTWSVINSGFGPHGRGCNCSKSI